MSAQPLGPIRKGMRRIEDRVHARFLTFSTYQRRPLFSNVKIRERFAARLQQAHAAYEFELFAWVVMPEHVHLLLRPRPGTLVAALASMKAGIAREVIARWREIDAPILQRLTASDGAVCFWQRGGGYDRNVFSRGELNEKIGYIHNNPVKRELVERPEDWEWSSARWYAGMRDGVVRVDPLSR